MKIKVNTIAGALLSTTLLFAGCSKQDSSQPTAGTESAEQSLEAANAEAEKQSSQLKASTDAAVAETKAQTQAVITETKTQTQAATEQAAAAINNATVTTTAQAQTMIDKAQAFVAEKKYSEAMNTLSQLTNVKLTTEQQDLVNKLKTQVQNALATQGANEGLKSVGGLLEKK